MLEMTVMKKFLNGPDFGPTFQPILSAPFIDACFRAKIGGPALFLFHLLESSVILIGNPHEYKRGALSSGCAEIDQRRAGMVHALAERGAFANAEPCAPMQQRGDCRRYRCGIGYLSC